MWRKMYFTEDFEARVRAVLKSGLGRLSHETGLIEPGPGAMDFDTNWLFVGATVASRDCYKWHTIMFNHFDLVPEYCRFHCYKIVVGVRDFAQAFKFFNMMQCSAAIFQQCCNLHGKCGIDSRKYTEGPFNAFFYCHGLEEALEKYVQVRQLVDEYLGDDVPVIIKRSCTEFERRYGSTDGEFWQEMKPEERDLERRLCDMFTGHWSIVTQPDWLKNKVFLRWRDWANSHGDKSWVQVWGKDDLTMKAITYHDLGGEVEQESEEPKLGDQTSKKTLRKKSQRSKKK